MATSVVAQQDNSAWEFLRGPNYDGASNETGLIEEWPEEGPPILWTRKLGQGYSGFTGRGDRVFTQYQSMTGQFVVCLNANTGETIWQYRIGWPHRPSGLYPGPRSTPTLSEDSLYFTSPDGLLGCLKQSNGELNWQQDLFSEFDAEPVEFGYSISPTIVNEKLLVPVGGKNASIVAINKHNGELIWKSPGDVISHAGLLPIKHNGRNLVVGYLKNDLVLLDLNSGEKLSERPLSEGYDEHSAWPIYSEPWLWIAAPFRRGSELLEITDTDPPTFRRLRQSYEMSNDVCSSVLVDGVIYGFDISDVQSKVHRTSRGQFRAIDLETGSPLWANGSAKRRNPEQGDIGHAAFVHADGKLVLLNDSGELILGRVSREGFDEIGRATVLGGDICWTQPTLLNGRVFLRNHRQAVCVFLGDPDLLDVTADQLTRTSDIRKRFHLDLASLVFSVEPEYAMDAPATGWLINWYIAIFVTGCIVAWAIAALLFGVIRLCRTIIRRKSAKKTTLNSRRNVRVLRRWVAALLGIIGTTLYSGWLGDFVFTWPLTVFVLFEVCVYHAAAKRGDTADRIWPGRLALLIFFVSLAAYYLACRRLSLAFEWAFLTGFPFAMPFLLLARNQVHRPGWQSHLLEWFWLALALTIFYWIGAGLIVWKY